MLNLDHALDPGTTLAFYWDTFQDADAFAGRVWDVIGRNLTDTTDLYVDGGILVEVYCPDSECEKLARQLAKEVAA